MKGFILQLFNESPEGLWDYQVCDAVFDYYNRSGRYWAGEVRATLTDLLSGALLIELEDKLDNKQYFGADKILVKLKLSEFGRERMSQTGLL
jgi:hypothetical protein